MTTFNPEIVEELELSHIARHIVDPYSDAALADFNRDWVVLGGFDLSNIPYEGVSPGKHRKWEGIGSNDFRFEHPVLLDMHRAVEVAAKLIIPVEHQDATTIYFSHESSYVPQGSHFTFDAPHVDGTFPEEGNNTQLRMWATATNAIPTGAYKGALKRHDFEKNGDGSNRLNPNATEENNLEFVELPLDTLVLLSPSTVHFAQLAKKEVPVRHFLRWQLHY